MKLNDAVAKLERLTAASAEPTLSMGEILDLLDEAARPDVDGLLPTDASWEPTYDFNHAAAMGWDFKAAKASQMTAFSADGRSFSSNQVYEHCMERAKYYRSKLISSVESRSASSRGWSGNQLA